LEFCWSYPAQGCRLPLIILLIGILERRRLFMNMGFVHAILSLITLRQNVHIAPLWMVLAGGGALLAAIAEGLRRFLNYGADNERAGFPAQPLLQDPEKRRALEMPASAATQTPQSASQGESTEFRGGGGKFGGGGSSSDF
jgi:uncharacterized membrane protein YgcG